MSSWPKSRRARREILLPKKHPSAFFGTPLASYLINVGADTVVVTGCTTSGDCGAASRRLRLQLPGLGPGRCSVYDRSATSHAVNLFDMASKYADVMPTSDALIALRSIG